MDVLFLKFRGFVKDLVELVFRFEVRKGSWYRKGDLINLALHTVLMNSYAEGMAETLREHKHVPTSETLLDYLKAATVEEVLDAAEALMSPVSIRQTHPRRELPLEVTEMLKFASTVHQAQILSEN